VPQGHRVSQGRSGKATMSGPAAPLRVLVVNPVGDLGGAELYLLQMLDATHRLQVEAILLRDGPLRSELERRGVCVTIVEVGRTVADVLRGTLRMRRLLASSAADVVVANGIKAQAVVGGPARLLGLPVVWIKHDHSYDRTLTPLLARLATRVVATAEAVAERAGRSDVVLVPPPRPVDPLAPADARARLVDLGMSWDPDGLHLAMTTRLTPYKGVDVAIEALHHAPGWNLVVLGAADPDSPGEQDRLVALSRTHGVHDRVTFLGYVPRAATLLGAFDALAVLTRRAGPKTPGREGFGMAAMEAMLAGVPVLAPDDGGSVARRTRDGAGVLVDATDPLDVARALRLLSDSGVRSTMAEESLARGNQFEDAASLAQRLVTLLASACNRPGAGERSEHGISVVSPVLNEIAALDRLVPTVVGQLRADDEFILVDSGSDDGTRERLAEWSRQDARIRLLEVAPCSIGASRNHGVRAARHDLIACTDAGCQPDATWLERLRSALGSEAAPDMVVGTFRANARTGRLFEVAMAAVAWPDPEELRRAPALVRVWLRTFGPRFSSYRVDGRSVAFRRESFMRAGGFPESLLTAEDEAFGRAMLDSGARSELVVDATVTWWQRGTIPATWRQFRGYGRGGANSGSRLLLTNELLRVSVYLAIPVMLTRRAALARLAGTIGLGAILGFPAHRVVRRGQPLRAIALIPVAQFVKDGGKLAGVVDGLVLRRRGRLPHGGGKR
jgi:glycosyltransferase involved in cell wall biosynthesis